MSLSTSKESFLASAQGTPKTRKNKQESQNRKIGKETLLVLDWKAM
jgi:hypothetical protein